MKRIAKSLVLLSLLILCGCNTFQPNAPFTLDADKLNKSKLIEQLVGSGLDDTVCRLGKDFNSDSAIIDAIFPGKFVTENDEYLIVLRPKAGTRISHASGFYHRYIVVLDKSLNQIVSKPKCFEADVGLCSVLSSDDKSYLLFLGSVEYQGDEERCGGIYEVDNWNRIWPSDDMFWNDFYVDYNGGKFKVYKRESNRWVYSYSLLWDEKAGRLFVAADHYTSD